MKSNNNNKRTHDVFIRESNNSENKIKISKEDTMFLYGNQRQWKLNNNKKGTHDVFMGESNNSENKIIISKEDTMFLYGNQTTVKTK